MGHTRFRLLSNIILLLIAPVLEPSYERGAESPSKWDPKHSEVGPTRGQLAYRSPAPAPLYPPQGMFCQYGTCQKISD